MISGNELIPENDSHPITAPQPREDPVLFSAVLTPHRSLGSLGFVVLMSAVGFVSFVGGIVFLVIGAWPVFGFFGLDVVLIYWAFRANYRAAKAFEQVTMTACELTVRRVTHRGRMREWTFNPLWTKLERETHEEFGIENLFLVTRGRKFAVAGFLGPDEKEGFATALSAALGEARRGPDRTFH